MSATPRTHNADGTRARGASNGNERGNAEDRRKRRAWLLETYASDIALIKVTYDSVWTLPDYLEPKIAIALGFIAVGPDALPLLPQGVAFVEFVPTARCYRCGKLLHDGTLTVDRIIPGAHGGTYARNNIRPACGPHNSSTGATVRRKR